MVMEFRNILLITIGFILDLIFIFVDNKYHNFHSIYLKSLASLSFVLLALFNYKTNIQLLLVAALAFDMLGDFILIIRNIDQKRRDLLYILGTIAFLIAHILLVIYVLKQYPSSLLFGLILGFIVFVIIELFFVLPLVDNKIFIAFGSLYLFFIILTCSVSIVSYINFPSSSLLVFTIGTVMFTLSDIILVYHKFKKEAPNILQPIYRILYFISQVLIAISLNFNVLK